MCRPRSSDGGPVVSHTQHPVGDRVSPSRCTSAFWQVHHGAGDAAAARRFTRASPRDVDWLSSGVRREGGGSHSPARRPWADSRCTSRRAPPYPPRPFWARNCRPMLIVCRRDGVPSSAGNGAGSGLWSPLSLRAPPAIQLRSPK